MRRQRLLGGVDRENGHTGAEVVVERAHDVNASRRSANAASTVASKAARACVSPASRPALRAARARPESVLIGVKNGAAGDHDQLAELDHTWLELDGDHP